MNTTSKLNFKEFTILIVDDNPANLGVIAEYLEDCGFDVMAARDGEHGLRIAQAQPDLILLDVMMPGIDGFEVCRRLKSNESTNSIPVIFMTALTDIEDKVKGFLVGGVDYITKPIQHEEVLARITTHLQIQKQARQLQEQNTRLQQANALLTKRALRLEASSEVGQQVTSILDLDTLLLEIVILIQSKFGYYFVGVWLLTEQHDAVVLHARKGRTKGQLPPHGMQISTDVPHSIITLVCYSKQPYLSDNVITDDKYLAMDTLPETASELTLPLQVGQEMIGVLDIQGDQIAAFDDEEQMVLQTLANQIAIAIRNARLYEFEKKLRQMEEIRAHDLAELNASKDKFFSIVAHDLRGPFLPLMGLSEMLPGIVRTSSHEDIEKVGYAIHCSAKNVYNLLENLLAWARIQMGRITFEPKRFNLNDIVQDNVSLLGENARSKNISLSATLSDTIFVYADRDMIDTVIRNLINNAVKFTPSGGQVKIGINPITSPLPLKEMETWDEHFVEVHVNDTGVGIKPKDIDKLFHIDVHHSTTGTNKEAGTGLGLIMCKEMIEKNGGKIWVESEFGKGTTVKFTMQLDSIIKTDDTPKSVFGNVVANHHALSIEEKRLVLPTYNEIVILHELAVIGDMESINTESARIAQIDEQYVPFANTLIELAKQFKDEEIITLLEQYLLTSR